MLVSFSVLEKQNIPVVQLLTGTQIHPETHTPASEKAECSLCIANLSDEIKSAQLSSAHTGEARFTC